MKIWLGPTAEELPPGCKWSLPLHRGRALFVAPDGSNYPRGFVELAKERDPARVDFSQRMPAVRGLFGGVLFRSTRLDQMLFELLTIHSDPTGESAPRPILPTRTGYLRLRFANRVISEDRFSTSGEAWRKIRDSRRQDYLRLKTAGGPYLKWLALQSEKLGVHYRELQTGADEPPENPTTVLSDGFDNFDDWTATIGTWGVTGGEVRVTTQLHGCAYHNEELSDDDHFAQINETLKTGAFDSIGPMVRVADTGPSFNGYAGYNSGNSNLLRRYSGGAATTLASEVRVVSLPELLRVDIDGSDLTFLVDDVEQLATTDTTYSGQSKVGLFGYASDGRADDFLADDGASGGGQAEPYDQRELRAR